MENLDLNMVFSEAFLKTSFPKKRVILKDYLLEEAIEKDITESCKNITFNNHTQRVATTKSVMEKWIGQNALCFHDKQQDDEGSGHRWFLHGKDTDEKLKSITANKFYKILDVKENDLTGDILIKIDSDSGRKSWVMANRFLYGDVVLRKLRAEKLKQLF